MLQILQQLAQSSNSASLGRLLYHRNNDCHLITISKPEVQPMLTEQPKHELLGSSNTSRHLYARKPKGKTHSITTYTEAAKNKF